MTRAQEAEELKKQIANAILDSNDTNPIQVYHVSKQLFIEMAFCFIAKHGQ